MLSNIKCYNYQHYNNILYYIQYKLKVQVQIEIHKDFCDNDKDNDFIVT